jgi:hypothetical protein
MAKFAVEIVRIHFPEALYPEDRLLWMVSVRAPDGQRISSIFFGDNQGTSHSWGYDLWDQAQPTPGPYGSHEASARGYARDLAKQRGLEILGPYDYDDAPTCLPS